MLPFPKNNLAKLSLIILIVATNHPPLGPTKISLLIILYSGILRIKEIPLKTTKVSFDKSIPAEYVILQHEDSGKHSSHIRKLAGNI